MKYKQHFKKNISLAYPVMLSQLGHVSVGVVDSIMVGKVGVEPLAAVSVSNSIFYLILMFGIGISYAITPLVAQADGKSNYRTSAIILKNGLLTNLVVGVVLFLLLLTASEILPFLNQPEKVVQQAIPYLNIIAMSLIPFMLFQTLRQFVEGLSMTKLAMFVVIGSNIINVILNYILIFGKLGFEPMGLTGAGWATFTARLLMGIVLLAYIYYSPKFIIYRNNFFKEKFSVKVIKKLLIMGVPIGLQFVFEIGAFAYAAIMVGWVGANALAAHQIAINLSAISYMMATGISAAATIRVGNQLGQKNIRTMRTAGFTSFIMVGVFMAICGTIFITCRNLLPQMYINDTSVITLASSLLIIAAFFQISDGIQVVGLGALRGMEDIKIPTLITLIAYWIVGLPIGYVLGFWLNMGPIGIWLGLLTGLTLAAVLLFIRFNYFSKKIRINYVEI